MSRRRLIGKFLAALGLSVLTARVLAQTGLSATPDRPIAFGYKVAWLAIKSTDIEAVARGLGLRDPRPANWETGFDAAFRSGTAACFLTPPIDGWILAVNDLHLTPDTEEGSARLTKILEDLSREFGECQYFGSYRVVGYAAWFGAVEGKITRGYAYADGTFYANIGEVTAAEKALGFGEIGDLTTDELAALAFAGTESPGKPRTRVPNEDDPARIAEAWSVDPLSLELRDDLQPGVGILGILP